MASNVKLTNLLAECRQGAHHSEKAIEPVGDKPLKSVTHGQWVVYG